MYKTKLFLALTSLALGILLGYFLNSILNNNVRKNTDSDDMSGFVYETREGGYNFINPLLNCDNFHPSKMHSMVELKNSLNEYIKFVLSNGTASHVSVYIRSLNNGPWIGINEQHNYTPASLLKVPILIAVLKKAEKDPSLLSKKIDYDTPYYDPYYFDPNIRGSESLQVGKSYTVADLLNMMIIHSDNEAKELLTNLVGEDRIFKVMADLGVDLSKTAAIENFITVKEYASFFRILFNATYLSREMSEKALEILSKTEFRKGIPNKLPENIIVSHKFGERGYTDSDLKQLHDCGIVYLPGLPYLICVMTKGNDFEKLSEIISEISSMVYYHNVNSLIK